MLLKSIFPLFLATSLCASHQETLYNGLDPLSVREHIAFYQLYPSTPEGQKAKEHLEKLLPSLQIELDSVVELIELFNSFQLKKEWEGPDFEIAYPFAHLSLLGHKARSETEVLSLAPQEVDLSRAVLLCHLGPEEMPLISRYEALLDAMALEVLARLPENPTDLDKLKALNHILFHEIGFHYPQKALYEQEVYTYSSLFDVLNKKKGICMGTTVLYLSIGQRLGLPLVAICPTGHILVRYKGNETIDIETTARGVFVPEDYFIPPPKEISIKEVIGHILMNQGGDFILKNPQEAQKCYEKALLYLPQDSTPLLLQGYSFVMQKKNNEAKKAFEKVLKDPEFKKHPAYPLLQDLFANRIDFAGLKTFLEITFSLKSHNDRPRALESLLQSYPHFSVGLLYLAQEKAHDFSLSEAYHLAQKAHAHSHHFFGLEFFSLQLALEMHRYEEAWDHFSHIEALGPHPSSLEKKLKALKKEISKEMLRPQKD